MVKNGNFTLLLTSSGQEWQFHIATDGQFAHCSSVQELEFHIATDISVKKMDNFTLLLISSSQEWQFHIATDI